MKEGQVLEQRFFEAVGLNVAGWDKRETSQRGPFTSILDFDIFVNCAYDEQATTILRSVEY